MKLAGKTIRLSWIMIILSLASWGQNGQGSGGSMEVFKKHTFRLQQLPEEKYSLCGKKIRDELTPGTIENWMQAEFYVAEGIDASEALPYLVKCVSFILEKNSLFLPYEKMKSEVIDQTITIDSRVIIRYYRDSKHPLLGSKYIVLNVDSERKLAYVKWDDRDGLISIVK